VLVNDYAAVGESCASGAQLRDLRQNVNRGHVEKCAATEHHGDARAVDSRQRIFAVLHTTHTLRPRSLQILTLFCKDSTIAYTRQELLSKDNYNFNVQYVANTRLTGLHDLQLLV
jgi:hypothetical protein